MGYYHCVPSTFFEGIGQRRADSLRDLNPTLSASVDSVVEPVTVCGLRLDLIFEPALWSSFCVPIAHFPQPRVQCDWLLEEFAYDLRCFRCTFQIG